MHLHLHLAEYFAIERVCTPDFHHNPSPETVFREQMAGIQPVIYSQDLSHNPAADMKEKF